MWKVGGASHWEKHSPTYSDDWHGAGEKLPCLGPIKSQKDKLEKSQPNSIRHYSQPWLM